MVVHSDQQLIAMSKPGGMPTQEDQSGDASLHRITQAYCKHDLYLVHRLDRPCSGLVLFAKTRNSAAILSEQWRERSVQKEYLAVVPKGLAEPTGRLTHQLEHKSSKTHVVASGGQPAVLEYEQVAEIDRYALLRISLVTGRTHQIRAQLSAIGYPVKGDVKYGARRSNKGRFIHLHCRSMEFTHPTSQQRLHVTCDLPDDPVWNAFDFS